MAKKAYRVRNWKEYNKALIQRGSITLWIDEKSIQEWYADKNKVAQRGRPTKYSDTAILTLLILKQVYRLTLRSCQGFASSLLVLMNLPLEVPNYSRICRRQKTVELPKLPKLSETIHLVVDSSGLKVFGEGEWKVRQHGYTKRRTWRKLHLGVDEKSQLVVCAQLTKNNCGDDKLLPELLEDYQGNIHQVSADGAYDSHESYNLINARGATATIPTQPNPKHKPKTEKDIKRPRDQVVWNIQQLGRAEWKIQSGYHRRSLSETAFFRYKTIFGDKLMTRELDNQRTEALVRCHALNKMTMLGMPISVAI
jgi:hypothetical protein